MLQQCKLSGGSSILSMQWLSVLSQSKLAVLLLMWLFKHILKYYVRANQCKLCTPQNSNNDANRAVTWTNCRWCVCARECVRACVFVCEVLLVCLYPSHSHKQHYP